MDDASATTKDYKKLIQSTLVSEVYKNFTVKVVFLTRLVYVNFVRAEVEGHDFQPNCWHFVNFSLSFHNQP